MTLSARGEVAGEQKAEWKEEAPRDREKHSHGFNTLRWRLIERRKDKRGDSETAPSTDPSSRHNRSALYKESLESNIPPLGFDTKPERNPQLTPPGTLSRNLC